MGIFSLPRKPAYFTFLVERGISMGAMLIITFMKKQLLSSQDSPGYLGVLKGPGGGHHSRAHLRNQIWSNRSPKRPGVLKSLTLGVVSIQRTNSRLSPIGDGCKVETLRVNAELQTRGHICVGTSTDLSLRGGLGK